jgi:hypothetical protein
MTARPKLVENGGRRLWRAILRVAEIGTGKTSGLVA